MDGTGSRPIVVEAIPPDQVERAAARMPGMAPAEPEGWLRRDAAFGPAMALRDRLIAERPDEVIRAVPGSEDAQEELYAHVLDLLGRTPGYRVGRGTALRPDGTEVPLDPYRPLVTLGRLVQEDLCLMERRGDKRVVRTLDGQARAFLSDRYRIIDVMVEGISLAITQRSEFAAVVRRDGVEGLLAVLRARTTKMPATSPLH